MYNSADGSIRFRNAGSGTGGTAITWNERMRIDSSGNLLVGRTSTSDTNVGGMIRADGFVQSTRDGNIAADFNRNTSDGDIVRFSKGSSPVGTIGSTLSGARLTIDGTDGVNIQTFLVMDDAIYLGGTAAANALDDYEEGTWSPMSSTKADVYHARYTKIGNLVTINCAFNMKSGQSQDYIALPFVPSNDGAGKNVATNTTTNNRYAGTVSWFEASTSVTNLMLFHQGNQGANAYFIAQTGSQQWPKAITDTEFNTVAVSFTYQTG